MLRAAQQGGQWVADWWICSNDGEMCNREECKGAATRARALRFCTPRFSARTVFCCRFIEAMVLTLSVKHGQATYQLTETEDAGVSMLMQKIEELTGVPVRQQKLICQGKVLDAAATLKALKVKSGSKLMLMTSGSQTQVTPALSAMSSFTHKLICYALLQGQVAVQQVIKDKAAAAKQRAEDFRQKQNKCSKTDQTLAVNMQVQALCMLLARCESQ